MNNPTVLIKVNERLNKLSSSDYQNLQSWQIVEAFNKGQVGWCRRNVHGENLLKEGDEQSTSRIDDLEKLIVDPLTLPFTDKGIYFQSDVASWPANYMRYKRSELFATNDCCEEAKRMTVWLGEEANVDIYLNDQHVKPNFPWGETFITLTGNKVNLYHNKQFSISSYKLIYYRQPLPIQIIGVVDMLTKAPSTVEVECEFQDDLAEIFVSEAVKILAGDIENPFQVGRAEKEVETNN